MLEFDEINEKRLKSNLSKITTNPLKISINGRRFRDEEINIKLDN